MNEETKKCGRCGQRKPRNDFYVNRGNRWTDLQAFCKACSSAYCAERRQRAQKRANVETYAAGLKNAATGATDAKTGQMKGV